MGGSTKYGIGGRAYKIWDWWEGLRNIGMVGRAYK